MSVHGMNPRGNHRQNITDLRTAGPNSDIRVFSATTGKLLRMERYDGTPLPDYAKNNEKGVKTCRQP